ncbi:MAG: cyclic pyranopterin monophosphate synthase MoaC [Desulfovibrionaceae bacterium]
MSAPKDDTLRLSHVDETGRARMVDVGGKTDTKRRAIAACEVVLAPATMALVLQKALPKGDVLSTARIAGVLAAKKTGGLIPLCHPIFLSFADVIFETDEAANTIRVIAESRTTGPTGVEMEAMMAAHVAALTIYDMVKAVQKDVVITNLRLLHKSGGKSGTYNAPDYVPAAPADSAPHAGSAPRTDETNTA